MTAPLTILAGLMEPSGIVRCFNRLVETLKLRYENFIGDGDYKAYLLKKDYVSKELKDGKTLRGRLLDKDIN